MTLQCRKHWSSFQFLLRVSPKRYIFLPIIIYFGRKTKETGVTFYYLIYFPLKFDLFIVFIILFMKVEDTPFWEGHSTAMQGKGNSEKNDSLFPFTPFALKPKSSPNLCVNSSFSYVVLSTLLLSSKDLTEWSLVYHSTLSYQRFYDLHSIHYDHLEGLHQLI